MKAETRHHRHTQTNTQAHRRRDRERERHKMRWVESMYRTLRESVSTDVSLSRISRLVAPDSDAAARWTAVWSHTHIHVLLDWTESVISLLVYFRASSQWFHTDKCLRVYYSEMCHGSFSSYDVSTTYQSHSIHCRRGFTSGKGAIAPPQPDPCPPMLVTVAVCSTKTCNTIQGGVCVFLRATTKKKSSNFLQITR